MVNSELLECGIQLKDPGIPLVIGIQNLSSANKESGIQYLGSEIHSVESRIQDCLPLHGRDSPHLTGVMWLFYLQHWNNAINRNQEGFNVFLGSENVQLNWGEMLTWFYEFLCSCRCSCECPAGAAQTRMTTNFLFNLFSVQGFQKVKVKHRRTFAVT